MGVGRWLQRLNRRLQEIEVAESDLDAAVRDTAKMTEKEFLREWWQMQLEKQAKKSATEKPGSSGTRSG